MQNMLPEIGTLCLPLECKCAFIILPEFPFENMHALNPFFSARIFFLRTGKFSCQLSNLNGLGSKNWLSSLQSVMSLNFSPFFMTNQGIKCFAFVGQISFKAPTSIYSCTVSHAKDVSSLLLMQVCFERLPVMG